MATLLRRDDDDYDSSCGCHFDPANIAPMSPEGDRKACFMSCMAQFLESILGGSESAGGSNPEGKASRLMCEELNSTLAGGGDSGGGDDDDRFWPLYWCDMNYCGLGVDQVDGKKGQDRECPLTDVEICGSFLSLLAVNIVEWILNHDDS